jgi:hypothetical protein
LGVEQYTKDELVISGPAKFATICAQNNTAHGVVFAVVGRVSGDPRLTNMGTYDEQGYDGLPIKDRATVKLAAIRMNRALIP